MAASRPEGRGHEVPLWLAGLGFGSGDRLTRARWGFRHETWLVTRGDGSCCVVQRRVDGSDPSRGRAPEIRAVVRAVGLSTPEPRRVSPEEGVGVVIEMPCLAGVVGAELLTNDTDATSVGGACGDVATRLAQIAPTSVSGVALPTTWASGEALTAATASWMAVARPLLRRATHDAVRHSLARAATLIDAARPVLAHGDLAPVNVLLRHGQVIAALDLDRVQLAHPAYDAAWFAWVVTFHHPDVARAACAGFAAASGVPTGPLELGWLWPLLLLERLAEAPDETDRRRWADRLAAIVRSI